MIRISSIGRAGSGLVLAAALLLDSSCTPSKKPIVVGSKDTPAQVMLGELVAQHLEHRLGRKVARNLSLGNTSVVYQALMNGEVGIYPEEIGTIQATVLKESPSLDAATALERVRNEVRRIAQAEVMDPLGIDNSWSIVVRKSEAESNRIETLSDAQNLKPGWRLGVTRDFNERTDGLPALNQYRLPMAAMTFVSDPNSLYDAFKAGKITMVAGNATDWQLARFADLKVLPDDRKVFGSYQTCLLARRDLLANDPKIQPALAELSGRISTADIQRLNAEVGGDRKKPADVAAEFLSRTGLK
jgi:glycine betaine/choline ABC-type transport system substrate-binding protein